MKTKNDVVEEFRKQSICAAAMRAVARKGMKNVTVQDIANEAGVAKGTVYIYFQSRDEILQQTMDDAIEKLIDRLAVACRECRTFREILEQRVRAQIEHFDENRDFFRLYLAMSEPWGERRLRKHPTHLAYLAQLETLVTDAIKRGDIGKTNVKRAAIAVAAVIREVILNRTIEREPPPLEDDVRFAVDFVMQGLESHRETSA